MSCTTWKDHDASWKVTRLQGKKYDDPIQGEPYNCALIAALSAVAWTGNTEWLKISKCSTGYNYKFSFYNTRRDVVVSDSLPWDGTKLCWAHTLTNEIWPALYEKAYGAYLLTLTSGCPTTPPSSPQPITTPNWLSEPTVPWGGNPITTLGNLVMTTNQASHDTICTDEKLIIRDMFDRFLAICSSYTSDGSFEHLRTKNTSPYYAAVAMTHPDTACYAAYSDSGPLKINHSYSVLGIIKDLAYDTNTPDTFIPANNYIVARNPLANDISTFANAPTSFRCSSSPINCDGSNGVIAIPSDIFIKAFKKYGWVW